MAVIKFEKWCFDTQLRVDDTPILNSQQFIELLENIFDKFNPRQIELLEKELRVSYSEWIPYLDAEYGIEHIIFNNRVSEIASIILYDFLTPLNFLTEEKYYRCGQCGDHNYIYTWEI